MEWLTTSNDTNCIQRGVRKLIIVASQPIYCPSLSPLSQRLHLAKLALRVAHGFVCSVYPLRECFWRGSSASRYDIVKSLYQETMSDTPSLKPVIWVGSSLRDLRAFPDTVQDHMGYALYVAQRGEKHRDAKTLGGFGGAGWWRSLRTSAAIRFAPCTRCDTEGRCMCCTPSRRSPRAGAQLRAGILN